MSRVNIGRRNEPKIESVIKANQDAGYDVYVDQDVNSPDLDTFFILLDRSSNWTSSEAQYRPMPSGLYVFRDKEALFIGERYL